MRCEVGQIMQKDENYARGWVRLFGSSPDAAAMEQFALELQKLRRAHEGRCEACQKVTV